MPTAGVLAAEQDYAFAEGLLRDSLYELAARQFEQFVSKYPDHPQRLDAEYQGMECRFREGKYDAAARGFERFIRQHPESRLSGDAYFRLGECFLELKQNRRAAEAFRTVLDRYSASSFAGEAAYWIGEASFRDGDLESALKYYELAYENYPRNKLRDYALYSIGWVDQKKEAYGKAIEAYRRLLNEFPGSSLTGASQIRIAECQFAQEKYQETLAELERAKSVIRTDEDRGVSLYLSGETYFRLKQYEQAQKKYEEFLETVPVHRLRPDATYGLGWVLLKLGKFADARRAFDSLAVLQNPLAEAALFRRGVVEGLMGQADAALSTWRSVLDRWPKGEYADNALYESGVLKYNRKDLSAAKGLFERATREFPKGDVAPDAARMLGECLLADSSYGEAYHAFTVAAESPGASFDVKVSARFQRAWCLFKSDRMEDAVAAFSDFLATYPQHPRSTEARYWRAESYYRLGRYGDAMGDYDAVVATPGSTKREDGLYGSAWCNFKQGNYDRAIAEFEQVIALNPNGAYAFDAQLRLGDCYFYQKQFEKASGLYRAVIRTYSGHAGLDYAYFQLAQASFRARKSEDAVDQYRNLVKTFPRSSLADDAQYAVGWIFFQDKEYLKAIQEFQTAARSFPESDNAPRALYSIGDAYYNLGNYAAAEQSYRAVLAGYPSSPFVADAVTGVQYCLVAQGKREAAVGVIDEFLREHPGTSSAQNLQLKRGDIYFSLGDYARALREYDEFLKRNPQSPLVATADYWAGRCLRARGDLPGAVDRFRRAAGFSQADAGLRAQALYEAAQVLDQRKEYPAALEMLSTIQGRYGKTDVAPEAALLRARLFQENGDAEESRKQFEFTAGTYPGTPAADKARLDLAKLSLAARKFDAALGYATGVATSRTDEIGAEGQYLVGVVYAAQGKLEDAITALLKIRYVFQSYDQWMARSYLELGKIYERLKEPQRARDAYRRSLRYEKYPDVVSQAQARLRQLEKK